MDPPTQKRRPGTWGFGLGSGEEEKPERERAEVGRWTHGPISVWL